MKKIYLFFYAIFLIFIQTSCKFSNAPLDSSDMVRTVRSKTSMQPFSHLEEPGVFVINANSKKSIFSTKSDRIGIIIVVQDFKTNEVFDWCFYEGIIGNINVIPTKMGAEKDLYYITCYNSNKLLKLDPETSQITEIIPSDEHLYAATRLDFNNCKSDLNIISMSATHSKLNKFGRFFKVFNSKTDTFSHYLFIDYLCFSIDPSFYPDKDDNIWFTQNLLNENETIAVNVRNINLEELTVSEPKFTLTGTDKPANRARYGNNYLLSYINEDYFFFTKFLYYGQGISLVDLKSGNYEEKFIPLPNAGRIHEINGEIYCTTFIEGESDFYVGFWKVDLNTLQAEKLTDEIPFHYYCSEQYALDDKIFVVDTIDPSDIIYFHFNTKTNTTSEVMHFKINEFLDSLC